MISDFMRLEVPPCSGIFSITRIYLKIFKLNTLTWHISFYSHAKNILITYLQLQYLHKNMNRNKMKTITFLSKFQCQEEYITLGVPLLIYFKV